MRDRGGDDAAAVADLNDGEGAAADRAVGIALAVRDRAAACLAGAV